VNISASDGPPSSALTASPPSGLPAAARLKRNSTVAVRVLLEEFTANGAWMVVSAPASAVPDAPILITVKRR